MEALTQSQPVGGGVTEIGDNLSEELNQVTDLTVKEKQGVVTKREYVEMPQYQILFSISGNIFLQRCLRQETCQVKKCYGC